MARYLIGIDLGTTNSALAYVDLAQAKRGPAAITTFEIPQLIGPAETAARPLLPSFLYLPGTHDLPSGANVVPWSSTNGEIIGEFARTHGAKVPGRLVSSAKSWLCHFGVDRLAPLLPWSAPPDVERISPLEATARLLRHLVQTWNHTIARGDDESRMEAQSVVITVPASFDDVARNLTIDAARQCGLQTVTLLEEPQAAFYAWLSEPVPDEFARLQPGMSCLVVDVGGGTTDFSLIQAVEEHGSLSFIRQAVGDHLLLGGDNMDLALAIAVEKKLAEGQRLDAGQLSSLAHACRIAKEALLAPTPAKTHTVSITGRGRKLIGGTIHAELTPDDVRESLFNGFFPDVPLEVEPRQNQRSGLHEMGLPYVGDPAITKHLAAFLKRHAAGESPAVILFNGGVFQPETVRARLIEVMAGWFNKSGWRPLVLTNRSLDLAVARGAAHFAWLAHTGGKRIGGGLARSYYVGVDGVSEDSASDQATVVCIVPRHLEEGRSIELARPELDVALGQPVTFPLYTTTTRDDQAGEVLTVDPRRLLRLPPLHTVLRGGKRSGTKRVPVTLTAKCTEIGTLELWCVARDGENRWRLEFNVRDTDSADASDEDTESTSIDAIRDVWPEANFQRAASLIRDVFARPTETTAPPRELTKAMEAALESPRNDWPLGVCRRLWEPLLEVADSRRRSPAHVTRWFFLAGFFLRPGFGESMDRFRVEQLWKVLQSPSRAPEGSPSAQLKTPESGADYWIMWRRVAGGLHAAHQQTLFERLRPSLLPPKGKAYAKPAANELAEMWRVAASLERLGTKHKEQLGDAIIQAIRRRPAPVSAFWSLTRLGARLLLYGPLNNVMHPDVVSRWVQAILPFDPENDSERLAHAFCLSQLARRSGQRAIDIAEDLRDEVLDRLRSSRMPDHWIEMVERPSSWKSDERAQMFGESLPAGLRLRTERSIRYLGDDVDRSES